MKASDSITPISSYIDIDGSWYVEFKEKDIKRILKKFNKKFKKKHK